MKNSYDTFIQKLALLVSKRKDLVINTLSNIFTMRLVGNKTHGDLAEIGMAEFINQFMYDYKCEHVGKDRFRAKEHEEDIEIIEELSQARFPVSLKAYGDGPLQLSTDSAQTLFSLLEQTGKDDLSLPCDVPTILQDRSFQACMNTNIIPLIYSEARMKCNIMIFSVYKVQSEVVRIMRVNAGEKYDECKREVVAGGGRKHPVYIFLNASGGYVCEVRYGDAKANALQRGLWTHTKHAIDYFDSVTDGWIDYSHRESLVQLFCLALNSREEGQLAACKLLQDDINQLVQQK